MGIVLKLTVGKAEPMLRGQDHFWRVMRALGADGRAFSASQVAALSAERGVDTICTYVRRLSEAGYVEALGKKKTGRGRPEQTYRLLKTPETAPAVTKPGTPPKRPTSAQQAMWNTMRGPMSKAGFTAHDLVAYGSTDDLRIATATAKRYIAALRKAGYFIIIDPGGPNRPSIQRLRPAMNSGPRPPMILTAKLVFDQNRERVAGEVIAEEEPS
jgi:hypothetical protein